jgi:hypothetical protein
MQGERTDLPPMPKCKCGCGQPVLRRHRRYLGGHVPHALRAEGGRKGCQTRIYRHRRTKFAQAFEALTRDGRVVTKETFLTVLADVFRDAYGLGYRACETKYRVRGIKPLRRAA